MFKAFQLLLCAGVVSGLQMEDVCAQQPEPRVWLDELNHCVMRTFKACDNDEVNKQLTKMKDILKIMPQSVLSLPHVLSIPRIPAFPCFVDTPLLRIFGPNWMDIREHSWVNGQDPLGVDGKSRQALLVELLVEAMSPEQLGLQNAGLAAFRKLEFVPIVSQKMRPSDIARIIPMGANPWAIPNGVRRCSPLVYLAGHYGSPEDVTNLGHILASTLQFEQALHALANRTTRADLMLSIQETMHRDEELMPYALKSRASVVVHVRKLLLSVAVQRFGRHEILRSILASEDEAFLNFCGVTYLLKTCQNPLSSSGVGNWFELPELVRENIIAHLMPQYFTAVLKTIA